MRLVLNFLSAVGLTLTVACGGPQVAPPPPMPVEDELPAPAVPVDAAAPETAPAAPSCGSPQACFEAAEAALDSDPAKAAAFHKQACDQKHGPSCVRLGQMTFDGMGVTKDGPAAFALFTLACDFGNAAGCGNVGVMRLKGIAVDVDQTAAVPFLVKACQGGYGEACFNSGIVYLNGLGVPADRAKAIEMFDAACQVGHGDGCKAGQQLRDEESKPASGVVGANVTVGSMTVDGLTLSNLSCKLAGGGLFASAAAIGSLAKQKKLLNRCAKDKPLVTWTFKGGRAVDVKVEGAKPKDAKCITRAMKKVRSQLSGQCSATIEGK